MADVIEEYLVKIGYKSDKVGYKQSMGMVNGIGISALGAAGKIAQIGLAVTAATTAFAYNMRKMYFTSQLAGSSVENIKAVGFAAKQAGVSSEAMTQAQLNFARAIRTNPGISAYLKSLGVKVEGRQMSDVVIDTVEAINNLKIPQGAKEGLMQSYFGMSGDDFVLLAAKVDKIRQDEQKAKKVFDRLNTSMAEGQSVVMHYTEQLDLMGLAFDGLGYKIGIEFVDIFDKLSVEFFDWAEGFAYGIDNMGSLWDKFTDGLVKNPILHDLSLGMIGNAEASNAPAFSRSSPTTRATASTTTGKKKTRAERNNNPGNIEYKGGFARAHGAIGSDGRFAIFPDLETGRKAQAALLSNYGKQGINTVSGIVSKWSPAKEKGNNTLAYIDYVSRSMGVGANEQLNMNDPVVLGQLSRYMGIHEGMPSGATITQTNNFNITGSNAEQIAQEVVTKNDRASADLNRYTKSAYR